MSIELTKFDFVWLILLAILVLVIIIWLIGRKIKKSEAEDYVLEKIKKQWAEIESLVNQNSATAWKLAIMEADKLLDYALKSIGAPGKDLGERLKAYGYKYPKIKEVWPAHKVRNCLVHETDYQLNKGVAKRSLEQFKKALKVLKVL